MYSPNYSSDGVPPPLPPPVSSYRFFLPPPSCFPSLLPHDDDHRSSPRESSTFSVPRPRPPLASPPLSFPLSLYRLGVARMAGHYRGDGGREKKDGKRPLLILCEEGLRGEPRDARGRGRRGSKRCLGSRGRRQKSRRGTAGKGSLFRATAPALHLNTQYAISCKRKRREGDYAQTQKGRKEKGASFFLKKKPAVALGREAPRGPIPPPGFRKQSILAGGWLDLLPEPRPPVGPSYIPLPSSSTHCLCPIVGEGGIEDESTPPS